MRDTFLPFSPPLIGEEEIAEVIDTLRSDWITTGTKVKRLEAETVVWRPAFYGGLSAGRSGAAWNFGRLYHSWHLK